MDIWLYPALVLTVAIAFSYQNITELQEILKRCNPGDITENEYNKCICTPINIYECFPKPFNAAMKERSIEEKSTCIPGTVYAFGNTTCICSKKGVWPHTECERTFKSYKNDTTIRKRCKPNSYIKVNCNICKCGDEGYLDKARCTKNECSVKTKTIERRFIKQKYVYGSCEAKTWYSLAPCQLCYCISENKLVCNKDNSHPNKMYLHKNSFSICGQGFIKDALSLVPDSHNSRISSEEKQVKAAATPRHKTNVNDRHTIEKEKNEKPLQYDIEYSSESYEVKEEVPSSKTYVTKGIEVGDDISDSSLSEETDNEINLDVPTVKPKRPKDNAQKPFLPEQSVNRKKVYNEKRSKDNGRTLGDVLKPYLPVMLDKVFHMNLRKSLSMDHKAQCIPGAINKLNCNTCFCLKNNKLLCTTYNCDLTRLN